MKAFFFFIAQLWTQRTGWTTSARVRWRTLKHTKSQPHGQRFSVSPLSSPPISFFDPAGLRSPRTAALSGRQCFGQLCQRKQRGCGAATQTVVQRWPKWKHAYLAEAHGRCPLAVQRIGQRVNRKLYWCVPSEFGHHTDMCAERNTEDNRQSQTWAWVWVWEHTCVFLNQGSKKSLKSSWC